MKILKKAFALTLALIMALSVVSVSSSAADSITAPTLIMYVVSETDDTVVVDIALKSGEFNSIDFTMKTSSKITACTKIAASDELKALFDKFESEGNGTMRASNPDSMKFALVSTKTVNEAITLFTATFKKSTSAKVCAKDFSGVIDACTIFSGGKEYDVSDSSKFLAVEIIEFAEDSITMNYKKTITPEIKTTCSSEDIVWSSSNEKVAKVDENGNVSSHKTGTAVITAANADGSVSDSVTVTVKYSAGQWIIVILLFGWIWY